MRDATSKTFSSRRVHTFAAVLAGFASIGTAAMANAAAPADDLPQVAVKYGDLDLTSSRGAQLLYRRIVGAAEQVCPRADARDLAAWSKSRACREEAIARAVERVPSGQLAALYRSHGNGS